MDVAAAVELVAVGRVLELGLLLVLVLGVAVTVLELVAGEPGDVVRVVEGLQSTVQPTGRVRPGARTPLWSVACSGRASGSRSRAVRT